MIEYINTNSNYGCDKVYFTLLSVARKVQCS